MPLTDLPPTDTRFLFRPVASALVPVLRGLSAADWQRPTMAGTWVVRDVLAHLVDITLRRLSFHRDGMPPPPPPRPITSDRDFVEFINWLNAEWVRSTLRLSPRVLTDLFERAAGELADWFEATPLDAPALFGVSWAGEQSSEGWFDIGREFVELWHHQEQIRRAVGAASLADPQHLRAVLEVALRGLPFAYREVAGAPGEAVVLEVTGPAGGTWSVVRESGGWRLKAGEPQTAAARVRLSDDVAWQLLFNALGRDGGGAPLAVEGRHELATPLLRARAVIV